MPKSLHVFNGVFGDNPGYFHLSPVRTSGTFLTGDQNKKIINGRDSAWSSHPLTPQTINGRPLMLYRSILANMPIYNLIIISFQMYPCWNYCWMRWYAKVSTLILFFLVLNLKAYFLKFLSFDKINSSSRERKLVSTIKKTK